MFVDVTEIPEKIQVNFSVQSSICVVVVYLDVLTGSVSETKGAQITPESVHMSSLTPTSGTVL